MRFSLRIIQKRYSVEKQAAAKLSIRTRIMTESRQSLLRGCQGVAKLSIRTRIKTRKYFSYPYHFNAAKLSIRTRIGAFCVGRFALCEEYCAEIWRMVEIRLLGSLCSIIAAKLSIRTSLAAFCVVRIRGILWLVFVALGRMRSMLTT